MPSFIDSDATVALSAAQFDKLVELLTPGYEMAKLMLAAHESAKLPQPEPEIEPGHDATDGQTG